MYRRDGQREKILHKIISIVKENWLFCPWKEGFMRKRVRQWITLILAVVMIVGAVNNDYLITLATNADEVGTEAVSGNDAVEMQDVSGNAVAELASVSGNNAQMPVLYAAGANETVYTATELGNPYYKTGNTTVAISGTKYEVTFDTTEQQCHSVKHHISGFLS